MTEPGQRGLHEEICICSSDLLEQHHSSSTGLMRILPNRDGYLGIRVKEGELMIDPAKISGITDWPTTLTTNQGSSKHTRLLGYHRP